MYTVTNFFENQNINMIDSAGPFNVLEYKEDFSVFGSRVHKRQVACDLREGPVRTQAGAMQWMIGDVKMVSGVKSVGGLIGNVVKGKVTGESAAKPEYTGTGEVILEPTYKHILLEELADWDGDMVIEDGLFLACEKHIALSVVARSNLSSAVGGGEGLFNLCLSADEGIVCLESKYPREELIEIYLKDDEIKIDGPLAVCWSKSLEFTVERSAKTLIGSAMSGEGLVNVYRGTGKLLMAPVA